MAKPVALKVDVDTFQGMKEGVPRLLDLLASLDIRATFFLSFGPDNSGKALANVWRQKGFLKKMIRTKAPATYGLKTMLYGTLLPAPLIAARQADLVRRMDGEGHEVAVHAWDHRLWQDHLDELEEAKIREQVGRAFDAFERILSRPPRAMAAPAWRCTPASLAVQDSLQLEYCSDTRGEEPFLPQMEGRSFRTPQVPTSVACIEEIVGREVSGDEEMKRRLLASMAEKPRAVFPVHAEVEGNRYLAFFKDLLETGRGESLDFVPVRTFFERTGKDNLPRCPIRLGPLPGRAGEVALQGAPSAS